CEITIQHLRPCIQRGNSARCDCDLIGEKQVLGTKRRHRGNAWPTYQGGRQPESDPLGVLTRSSPCLSEYEREHPVAEDGDKTKRNSPYERERERGLNDQDMSLPRLR